MKKGILHLFIILLSYFPCVASSVEPHTLVIFGATGNLTQKKLLPALFHLLEDDKLPENFIYVAIGRKEKSAQDFHREIASALGEVGQNELLPSFINKCHYHQLDYENEKDFEGLENFLKEIDKEKGTLGNRLYYLATQPGHFPTIINNLYHHQMLSESDSQWARVVIEKPFGRDLASALTLQKQISECLDEKQVYLIDHYLGKEAVQNLLSFRLNHPLIEAIWNNQFIDNIQITMSEKIGVEERGNFWEETGLLRDIAQNHLIQLVSLIGMELPQNFDAASISQQKTDLISSISPFLLEKNPTILRGQYGEGLINQTKVNAYREEKGVPKDSNRETFVAGKISINSPRWQNVPFYFRAGKRLSEKCVEVIITFKHFPSVVPAPPLNLLVIRIQPNETIYFKTSTSTPLLEDTIKGQSDSLVAKRSPEAYEYLLHECMKGNHHSFVTVKEILASWRLFTPVLEHWENNPPQNFPNYSSGSWGPQEVDFLLEKDHEWHRS